MAISHEIPFCSTSPTNQNHGKLTAVNVSVSPLGLGLAKLLVLILTLGLDIGSVMGLVV